MSRRHKTAQTMTSLLSVIYNNGNNLVEEIKSCIARGDDVNQVTKHGESALRVASNRGRFDAVQVLLNAGADRDQMGWSSTIFEVVYGTCISIRKSVQENADLESTDFWQRTPFLFAVQIGDTEKAQLLLDLGANCLATGRCGKTAMQYAVQANSVAMLSWLLEQGFDIETADDFLDTALIGAATDNRVDCAEFLIQRGANIHRANHIPQRPIEVAKSLQVVQLLVTHGADINDISAEMHAQLLGVEHETDPQTSQEEYIAGKHRRFGNRNPEQMDIPFWLAMVRSGANAWHASNQFSDTNAGERLPVWCFQRYGRSTTVLEDGRIIEIAGEHEDHYDPDFCIYNDVTEFKADGSIRIFGYPEHVFPPTDFHTATLVDDFILIIGCLGYPQGRQFGRTPVYRLNVSNFEMREVETSGEQPGWIHRHKTRRDGRNHVIVSGGHVERGLSLPFSENIDTWTLDLATWVWTRSTHRGWPQWTFVRADRKPNHLWKIRNALWSRNAKRNDTFQEDIRKLSDSLGHEPDLDSVVSIYRVDGLTTDSGTTNTDGMILKLCVDGVAIRLTEDHWRIHVMLEGELPQVKLKAFQEGVLAKLSRLEGVAWEVDRIPG